MTVLIGFSIIIAWVTISKIYEKVKKYDKR